jgi:hypothetical protein
MSGPNPNPIGEGITIGQRLVYESLPTLGPVPYSPDLDSVHEYRQGAVFEVVNIGDESEPTLMLKDETGCLITVPQYQAEHLYDPVVWGLYHRREHFAAHRQARETLRQLELLKEILRAQANLNLSPDQAERLLSPTSP